MLLCWTTTTMQGIIIVMKEKIANKAYELGFEYEQKYRGCAQCTVAALQDAFEIKDDSLFRAASGLSSGGGLTCSGSCGAYVGSVMFMSSLLGRRREFFDNDDDFKYTTFDLAKQLHDRFVKEYGTILCSSIHQEIFGRTYDLNNQDDKNQFNSDGAHVDKCTSVVANGAKWCVELVYDHLYERKLLPDKFYH